MCLCASGVVEFVGGIAPKKQSTKQSTKLCARGVVELSPSVRICAGGNSEAREHLALLLASPCAAQLIFIRQW